MKCSTLYVFLTIILLYSCKANTKHRNYVDASHSIIERYIPVIDSQLMENSGLVYWDKLLWTFNDSGGKNEIYAISSKDGKIQRTIEISNASNVDWEDIAQNDEYLFVAETGNNFGHRKDLKIYRIKKSDITDEPEQLVSAEIINFNFADQEVFGNIFKRTAYDCEALSELNDTLYVFTKDWLNLKTKLYAMPNEPGDYNLMPIDSFDTKGLVTGVDINDKGEIALLGYVDFKSFVWLFNKSDSTFFDDPKFIDLGFMYDAQTEGVCYLPNGDLLISCERTPDFAEQIFIIKKKQLKQ